MKTKKEFLKPHYQRETAAHLMKDTELERIVELDRKFATKVDVLTKHYRKIKEDKARLHLDQFIIKQRKKLLEENARRLLERRKRDRKDGTRGKGDGQVELKPKTIELKNLEGNKNKNKEDNTLSDSNLLVEEINKIAMNILEEGPYKESYEVLAGYARDFMKEKKPFFVELMTNPQGLIARNGIVNEAEFTENVINFMDLLFMQVVENVDCSDLVERTQRHGLQLLHRLQVPP